MSDDTSTGTLPSPEVFEHYERVLPGSAERIIAMMEQQAEHRMRVEVTLVESAMRSERLGQVFGLSVVLFAFVVSAWLIFRGHSVSGTILGVTDLAGLVAVFAHRGSGAPAGAQPVPGAPPVS